MAENMLCSDGRTTQVYDTHPIMFGMKRYVAHMFMPSSGILDNSPFHHIRFLCFDTLISAIPAWT